MEFADFQLWKKLEMLEMVGKSGQSIDNEEHLMDQDVFELLSKKVWLDTLLQIIKVRFLPKDQRCFENTNL